MSRLHLDKKDFWRYPLDRALLKPLIKDGNQSLIFEKNLKIWKLDGVLIKPDNKKTYSKIAGFFLHLFHKIRMCFSPTYRKKFQAAKLKIENALLVAQKKTPQKVVELVSQLNEAIRQNDTIDKQEAMENIKEALGAKNIEQKINALQPEVRKFERQQRSKSRIKPLAFNLEIDTGL